MSFSNTSVVPRISVTPVLGTWSALFAGYHAYLSLGAARARVDAKKYLGESGVPDNSPVLASSRAFGNFSENVPFALLLAGVCELNGGSAKLLNGALATLFILRIAHADFGLKLPDHVEKMDRDGIQVGRLTGFLGSNGVIVALGAYAFSLCFPSLRSIYSI